MEGDEIRKRSHHYGVIAVYPPPERGSGKRFFVLIGLLIEKGRELFRKKTVPPFLFLGKDKADGIGQEGDYFVVFFPDWVVEKENGQVSINAFPVVDLGEYPRTVGHDSIICVKGVVVASPFRKESRLVKANRFGCKRLSFHDRIVDVVSDFDRRIKGKRFVVAIDKDDWQIEQVKSSFHYFLVA